MYKQYIVKGLNPTLSNNILLQNNFFLMLLILISLHAYVLYGRPQKSLML